MLETIKSVYNQIDLENLHLLETLYDEDVIFTDPFHKIEGLKNLKSYFEELYTNITHIHFDYSDEIVTDNKAALYWTMKFSHPKLKNGKEISVEGSSQLKWDNKILFHRDYFDAGSMLYEHIPLLGSGIRWVKQRM